MKDHSSFRLERTGGQFTPKTIICILFLLATSGISFGQVDYLEYKEAYSLSCGIPDSAEVVRNQALVDSISGMEIINGEKEFLYDYAWVYYMRYLKWQSIDDLKLAQFAWKQSWEKYDDFDALWNLGGTLRQVGNCKDGLNYTETYVSALQDSLDIDYQQIYLRYKYCRGKE